MHGTIETTCFDLDLTLASGQVFRCRKEGGSWTVCSRDRLIRLRQDGPRLEFSGAGEAFVRRFLGLDDDTADALERLERIPRLRPAIRACRGLRIVRHDPWECLVSFICSTRSNIPKIARSLDLLARRFGRPISGGGGVCAFPEPGSLDDLDLLRSTGVGYRAEYLFETNRLCTEERLAAIGRLPYEQAREALKEFPGVGDKVADCVCLFAFGFREAFPVDVWVRRAMLALYPRSGTRESEIRRAALRLFGPDAGYAGQYLFHHRRLCEGKAPGEGENLGEGKAPGRGAAL